MLTYGGLYIYSSSNFKSNLRLKSTVKKQQVGLENRCSYLKSIFLIYKQKIFTKFEDKLLHVFQQPHFEFLLGVLLRLSKKINESGVFEEDWRLRIRLEQSFR